MTTKLQAVNSHLLM